MKCVSGPRAHSAALSILFLTLVGAGLPSGRVSASQTKGEADWFLDTRSLSRNLYDVPCRGLPPLLFSFPTIVRIDATALKKTTSDLEFAWTFMDRNKCGGEMLVGC